MAFLSTEEVIEALDKDEPAVGSEMDSLSLHSSGDEPRAAISGEEEQPSTASEMSRFTPPTRTQTKRRPSGLT